MSSLFGGRDPDAAENAVDAWQEGFEERARSARELAGRMATLSVTARSSDRLVEVTVGRSGELTGLRLDEKTRQHSAAATAQAILATVAGARAALADKVTAIVDETVGADTAAGRAILDSYRR